MSRRDTIIIAVLLNAGLLIVLFATSLKTGKEENEAMQIADASPKVEEMQATAATPSGDAVDQVLKQYTSPTPGVAAAPQQNFAADLQSIAVQEPIVSPMAPAPVTPSLPAAELAFTEHKVKKGEVLERIARNHHTTVEEIMKLNNLSSTRLKIGQVLKIPTKTAAQTETSPSATPSETGVKYYTVKNGDNPWTIAVKNHMKVEDLLKLNNLDAEKARRLKPGDQLRIQ